MEELISRSEAIDALTRKMVSIPTAGEKDLMGDVNRIRAEDISVIRRFPSAQPETHDKRTETHACDLISRQAAIDAHFEYCNRHPDAEFPVWSFKILEDLPSAQLEKVDTPTVDTPTCEDAVSRQALKEWLAKWEGYIDADIIARMQYRIIDIPSAQPELNLDEWCTDCKEYDHEKHCCPRWNRVIRQTLKDMKEEQPEIIRCKDCKYSDTDNTIGVMFCWRVSYHEANEDGFCSWAERRTDDER